MGVSKKILDASDVRRILGRMADEIMERHPETDDLALVGIHTRGVFLAQRISSLISKKGPAALPTGSLDISLYRDDWTRITLNPVVHSTSLPFDVDGREIILIDDVLYTGRTVRAAMDAIIDFGRPKRIELCVLIDRGHRELPIEANYKGKFITTSTSEAINVMLSECDGEDGVEIISSGGDHG